MSSDTDTPLPKFSRYRSVRKTDASDSGPAAPQQPTPQATAAPSKNESISRSMSRYRRARPVNTPAHKLPSVPPVPSASQPAPLEDPFKTPPRSRARAQTPSDAGGEEESPLAFSHAAQRSGEQRGRGDSEAVAVRSREEGLGRSRTRREAEQTRQPQERRPGGGDRQTSRSNGQAAVSGPHSSGDPALLAKQDSRTGDFKSVSRKDHRAPPPSSGSGSSRDGPAATQFGGRLMASDMDAPVSAVNAGERVRWRSCPL
ncbi:hypothetical protein GP486_007910 [Trichoglossum hirsutum]|uniref:Uncharacterized protein n=1 Tax=Trichoglossum hirsutum TaxID=265104 RepID=A0A9P8IEY8_9PEZI|nr:hypothetical protein GP486_007910 [Trichoglossum hirsutum]